MEYVSKQRHVESNASEEFWRLAIYLRQTKGDLSVVHSAMKDDLAYKEAERVLG